MPRPARGALAAQRARRAQRRALPVLHGLAVRVLPAVPRGQSAQAPGRFDDAHLVPGVAQHQRPVAPGRQGAEGPRVPRIDRERLMIARTRGTRDKRSVPFSSLGPEDDDEPTIAIAGGDPTPTTTGFDSAGR